MALEQLGGVCDGRQEKRDCDYVSGRDGDSGIKINVISLQFHNKIFQNIF